MNAPDPWDPAAEQWKEPREREMVSRVPVMAEELLLTEQAFPKHSET